MPVPAPSSASVFTRPITPCLADTYPALNGEATRPCADATATKRPEPALASAGQAYLASRNGLVSRIEMSASQRSSGKSAMGETCWNPALAMTTSSRPKRSSAASTAARLPSRVVRSALNAVPGPPVAGCRSTASTSSPSASSRVAIAAPMPLAAPVTRAARRCPAMSRPFLSRRRELAVPAERDAASNGSSDGRRAGGCPPSRLLPPSGRPARPAVRVGSAEQVARCLRVGAADVLHERRVRRGERGDPVELAGAGHLLLEVHEALECLLVGVEGGEPGGLGALDEALVKVTDTLSGLLVGVGADAEGGVSLGSGLGGHGGLRTSWRFSGRVCRPEFSGSTLLMLALSLLTLLKNGSGLHHRTPCHGVNGPRRMAGELATDGGGAETN